MVPRRTNGRKRIRKSWSQAVSSSGTTSTATSRSRRSERRASSPKAGRVVWKSVTETVSASSTTSMGSFRVPTTAWPRIVTSRTLSSATSCRNRE